jgi:hypothetical protein
MPSSSGYSSLRSVTITTRPGVTNCSHWCQVWHQPEYRLTPVATGSVYKKFRSHLVFQQLTKSNCWQAALGHLPTLYFHLSTEKYDYPWAESHKKSQRCVVVSVMVNGKVHEVEFMKPPHRQNECCLCRCQSHTRTRTCKIRIQGEQLTEVFRRYCSTSDGWQSEAKSFATSAPGLKGSVFWFNNTELKIAYTFRDSKQPALSQIRCDIPSVMRGLRISEKFCICWKFGDRLGPTVIQRVISRCWERLRKYKKSVKQPLFGSGGPVSQKKM